MKLNRIIPILLLTILAACQPDDPVVPQEIQAPAGRKIGFKPAGGISTAGDALCYYSIVASVLGKDWLNKNMFRFGVSRVANSILSAVEQKTVGYF